MEQWLFVMFIEKLVRENLGKTSCRGKEKNPENVGVKPFLRIYLCERTTKKIFLANWWVYSNSHIRSVLFVQLPILPQKSP